MSRVLVIGQAVTDFVFRLPELPSRGEKYQAEEAWVVGGGVAANAAVAIARLGGEAVLVGRLGDDAVGRLTLVSLREEGVLCDHMRITPGGRSSFSAVNVGPDGERQIVNYRGCGMGEDPGDLAAIGPVDAVLADTRWFDGALAGLTLARRLGVPGVLDGEAPVAPELAAAASHLVFSESGLADFAAAAPTDAALAAVAGRLAAWVAVTRGSAGVTWTGERGAVTEPGFAVAAVDTLGAGDVWHGAFTLRLAEGAGPAAAARFANAAAALKCTGFGGRAAAPDRAATERLVKERR